MHNLERWLFVYFVFHLPTVEVILGRLSLFMVRLRQSNELYSLSGFFPAPRFASVGRIKGRVRVRYKVLTMFTNLVLSQANWQGLFGHVRTHRCHRGGVIQSAISSPAQLKRPPDHIYMLHHITHIN
jgi:hypothetical protein